MSSRKAGKKTVKKRAQRATSNVFAMFDQAQIQEFKEAFNMIDQNRDGFIDKDDLHDMLASLGNLLLDFCYLLVLIYHFDIFLLLSLTYDNLLLHIYSNLFIEVNQFMQVSSLSK